MLSSKRHNPAHVRCAAFTVVANTETALLAGNISCCNGTCCGLVLLASGPVLLVVSFPGVEDRLVVTVADDASVAWVRPASSVRCRAPCSWWHPFSGVDDRLVFTVADDVSVAWVRPESSAP